MRSKCQKQARAVAQGQNLVELALTFPFLIFILYGIMEVGRVWQTCEGAKLALLDGVYTATLHQDASRGETQATNRLAAARIPVGVAPRITPLPNGSGYTGSVTVTYQPLFGGVEIPSLSGPLTIIPNRFNFTYRDVNYYGTY